MSDLDTKTTDIQQTTTGLDAALRQARVYEGAHFTAREDLRDAQSLRLAVLYDDLMPVFKNNLPKRGFAELALVRDDPPRLWIDLITYVIMAPDPRSYRLMRDTDDGTQILFETGNRREMTQKITELIAHRLIDHTRQLAAETPQAPQRKFSTRALITAGLLGFLAGILGAIVIVEGFLDVTLRPLLPW